MSKPYSTRFAVLFSLALVAGTGCVADMDATGSDELGVDAGSDVDPSDEVDQVDEVDDSDDPDDTDGLIVDDEFLDDDIDIGVLAGGRPRFQMPFKCGQRWWGETRTNHSPQRAIDFNRAGDFGDLVVASFRGKVTRVANEGNDSYGRWIEIGHGNGYRTRYAHLSKQLVSKGQRVRRGQRIGRVGNSGGSFGAHLHYEQLRYGTPIRVRFNGNQVHYFGTRRYRSRNCR